jgi:hypothetical protein
MPSLATSDFQLHSIDSGQCVAYLAGPAAPSERYCMIIVHLTGHQPDASQ